MLDFQCDAKQLWNIQTIHMKMYALFWCNFAKKFYLKSFPFFIANIYLAFFLHSLLSASWYVLNHVLDLTSYTCLFTCNHCNFSCQSLPQANWFSLSCVFVFTNDKMWTWIYKPSSSKLVCLGFQNLQQHWIKMICLWLCNPTRQ